MIFSTSPTNEIKDNTIYKYIDTDFYSCTENPDTCLTE